MKPVIIIASILIALFLFSGSSIDWGSKKDERIAELEDDVYEYAGRVDSMKSAVQECNDRISDARSYAWENYDDMEDTLSNLEDCELPSR